MEIVTLSKDIKLMYVAATSFPNGVLEAHEKVHAIFPPSDGRRFFGISRPENGTIQYKAGVEELNAGEAEKLHLGTVVLQKGKYISLTIHDFKKDISSIGKAFQQLLSDPNIDSNGYCVELYLTDKDVQCMVRLKD